MKKIPTDAHVTYQLQYRMCGKRCRACPHGPYWYAYWREDGKLHSAYIGKEKPVGNEAG